MENFLRESLIFQLLIYLMMLLTLLDWFIWNGKSVVMQKKVVLKFDAFYIRRDFTMKRCHCIHTLG